MKQNYFKIILGLLLFATACSSGQRNLDRGNYDQAVFQAVKRLQQKPGHAKASAVLQDAYELAVNEHMHRIEFYDRSTDRYKWTQMADEYAAIEQLNRAIRRYPQYMHLVDLVDVTDELALTKQEASKVHIARGEELMARGSREAARLAYEEFKTASFFDNANNSIEQKINEAREAGTLNVALDFPLNEANSYMIPTKDLYYAVQNATRGLNYTFLRVVDINDPVFEADEIIRLSFDEILVGQVFVNQTTERVTRKDVKLGEVEVNDSTILPVYGEVHADLRTFTKTLNSSGVLLLQRVDTYSGAVLNRTRIPASFNWTGQWGDFRGDERALSDSQYETAMRNEPPPPSPQWLFIQMSKPLLDQSLRIFNDTYRYLR
ncbi:hypothetical protein GYB29_05415 [bacterium]|nr:hypothetical protein [bacterium]